MLNAYIEDLKCRVGLQEETIQRLKNEINALRRENEFLLQKLEARNSVDKVSMFEEREDIALWR